jgi:hypothetical protein
MIIKLLYIIPILIAICWIVYRWRKSRKAYHARQASQRNDFIHIFTNDKFTLPTLSFGSSYGWDSFLVSFNTKEDFENARQLELFPKFQEKIKSYYNADFNPESAIGFTFNEKK